MATDRRPRPATSRTAAAGAVDTVQPRDLTATANPSYPTPTATMKRAMSEFNPRQAAFVREFTLDHHAKNAAIRAGYSAKTAKVAGSKLMADPRIRAAIDLREQEMADRLGMTAEWVLAKLREVIEVATTPTPKLYQGEVVKVLVGEVEKIITEIDAAAALRGLETLMKHRGMLVDRQEITVDGAIEYTLHLDSELKTPTGDEYDDEETP